jgi:nicotinamidase-related amidase
MQNDFVLPGAPACVAGALETVPVIIKILDNFRENGLLVFHVTREYRADGSDVEITRLQEFMNKPFVVAGTSGCDIVNGLQPLTGEFRIVKKRFSAFMNTELDLILRRVGATDLVICGTQYPNCVRATIFDAVCLGYPVINIIDATSAETRQVALANIFDLRKIGVICVTLNEFMEASR